MSRLTLAQRQSYFESMVAREMEWHGLLLQVPQWKVAYDHGRRRAGMCVFSSKTLSFSRHLVARASAEQMRDTILHEIAHALAGPRHGHSRKWRKIALRIGCNGQRCHDMQLCWNIQWNTCDH